VSSQSSVAQVWFLSTALVAAGACGSNGSPLASGDGGRGEAGPEAGDVASTDVAEHPYEEVADCAEPDAGVIPPAPASCSAPVQRCLTAGTDSCLFTHLRASLLDFIKACDVQCGEFALAFTGGCATAIEDWGSSIGPTAIDCLRANIVGTRWDCAPSETWTRVYVDSCTRP
jgi:hypothetical protein